MIKKKYNYINFNNDVYESITKDKTESCDTFESMIDKISDDHFEKRHFIKTHNLIEADKELSDIGLNFFIKGRNPWGLSYERELNPNQAYNLNRNAQ